MKTFKLSALALVAGLVAVGTQAQNTGDRAAYDQTRATAKAAYDSARKACDSLGGNAKDICLAEAKARRVKADLNAEAAMKGTPKAREHAIKESAEADYEVAKERCDDKGGNEKDVCRREAKAAMTKTVADAKAMKKGSEARMDADEDKRKADYKVAAEKCDAVSGDARRSCIEAAKMKYGQ